MKIFDLFKKKVVQVYAPANGQLVSLDVVPDEMFQQRQLGEGVAIVPSSNVVCSPVEGNLSVVFETGHAFVVDVGNGAGVLVHIGIDTVNLNGEGFKILKSAGEKVKVGEPIMEVDFEFVRSKGLSDMIPVIMLNPEDGKHFEIEVEEKTTVNAGVDKIMEGRLVK